MIGEQDLDALASKVYTLLEDHGIVIENDELSRICLESGCSEGRDHRIRIPRTIVEEMAGHQRRSMEQYERDHELIYLCGPDWTHHLIWTQTTEQFRNAYAEGFLMQAFDCGATTYYDYPTSRVLPVDGAVFETMMKLAEATPEIGYTSTWYRQDLPPTIERIHSLVSGLKLTRKLDGIEAIYPEVIPYLKEASVIVYDDQNSSAFLAGSECMTMPLILEKRSAADILERRRSGVHRYHVASMPTLGISTPVTLAGAVVMAAAEILGGMAICWCADPESDLSGRMITLVADMRNGNSTTFGPEYARYNNAVRQLFSARWGGHCMVETFFSPTAQRPGLQAVFENFYGTSCRQRWDGNTEIPYAGMGTLHNGGLGSPTQLMLDMEIRKAQWSYKHELPVTDDTLAWDDILHALENRGDFLSTDHTMAHFREMWSSQLFRSESLESGGWQGDEGAILGVCDEMWRTNLEKWEPPEWPSEKVKALDALLARATEDLGSRDL